MLKRKTDKADSQLKSLRASPSSIKSSIPIEAASQVARKAFKSFTY